MKGHCVTHAQLDIMVCLQPILVALVNVLVTLIPMIRMLVIIQLVSVFSVLIIPLDSIVNYAWTAFLEMQLPSLVNVSCTLSIVDDLMLFDDILTACDCFTGGSVDNVCNKSSGICNCLSGVEGIKCDICKVS